MKACINERDREQRITSAYCPQSNGLCERQNRNIKDFFIKVLKEFSFTQKNIRM